MIAKKSFTEKNHTSKTTVTILFIPPPRVNTSLIYKINPQPNLVNITL
jgi:hypothetical protein